MGNAIIESRSPYYEFSQTLFVSKYMLIRAYNKDWLSISDLSVGDIFLAEIKKQADYDKYIVKRMYVYENK